MLRNSVGEELAKHKKRNNGNCWNEGMRKRGSFLYSFYIRVYVNVSIIIFLPFYEKLKASVRPGSSLDWKATEWKGRSRFSVSPPPRPSFRHAGTPGKGAREGGTGASSPGRCPWDLMLMFSGLADIPRFFSRWGWGVAPYVLFLFFCCIFSYFILNLYVLKVVTSRQM